MKLSDLLVLGVAGILSAGLTGLLRFAVPPQGLVYTATAFVMAVSAGAVLGRLLLIARRQGAREHSN